MLKLAISIGLVLGGCATTRGQVAAGVAVVAGGAAALTGAGCLVPDGEHIASDCPSTPTTLAVIAAVAAGVALLSEIHGEDPPPALPTTAVERVPLPPAPPLVAQVSALDPRAAQWTQQAYFAARLGQCGAVASLGGRVRDLDERYYTAVFTTDATIATCR